MKQNAIDHEKKERIDSAASMDRVPLTQLHGLIKERQINAINGNTEAVDALNGMIRKLLAV